MLNAARTTFTMTLDSRIIFKGTSIVEMIDEGMNIERGTTINLRIRMLMIESTMLVTGPAAAEIAISRLGFLKFTGFIGTGFA
jgi:hypothetical protein